MKVRATWMYNVFFSLCCCLGYSNCVCRGRGNQIRAVHKLPLIDCWWILQRSLEVNYCIMEKVWYWQLSSKIHSWIRNSLQVDKQGFPLSGVQIKYIKVITTLAFFCRNSLAIPCLFRRLLLSKCGLICALQWNIHCSVVFPHLIYPAFSLKSES